MNLGFPDSYNGFSVSQQATCRNWHHIKRADRLPRLHRAGPSASPYKSAAGAISLMDDTTQLEGVSI
jgi:hypothetical protein